MAEKSKLFIRRKGNDENTNIHRHYIPDLINGILVQADIILEVLDSRFIEKTRNPEIEKRVKELGKNLIYIINKVDLVEVNSLREKVQLQGLYPNLFFSIKARKWSGKLKRFLKIEAKKLKKEIVNVGIIGYPNTGKSSIINFLTGRSAARTSPEAGYTKGIQKMKLTTGLYLIDTPGIIPPKEKLGTNMETIIKNSEIGVITWDKSKDPDLIVHRIMKLNPGLIEKHYKFKGIMDAESLIDELGKKLSYLKKGNKVDEDRTARKILRDWQEGKIVVKQ